MKDYEIKTKLGDKNFIDVHPSISSSNNVKLNGRDLPPFSGVDGIESKYKRCRQCGFILDVQKVSRGSGYGNEVLTLITGITATKYNPSSGGGCPLCCSSEF